MTPLISSAIENGILQYFDKKLSKVLIMIIVYLSLMCISCGSKKPVETLEIMVNYTKNCHKNFVIISIFITFFHQLFLFHLDIYKTTQTLPTKQKYTKTCSQDYLL